MNDEAADYALNIYEKGYRITELASILNVDVDTMQQALDAAVERRQLTGPCDEDPIRDWGHSSGVEGTDRP